MTGTSDVSLWQITESRTKSASRTNAFNKNPNRYSYWDKNKSITSFVHRRFVCLLSDYGHICSLLIEWSIYSFNNMKTLITVSPENDRNTYNSHSAYTNAY